MSESISELTGTTIDAALPEMLASLVEDFHTPNKMSMGDKIKLAELFMKQRGLLQQEKANNFIPVEINFINGGELTLKQPVPKAIELQDVQVVDVEIKTTEPVAAPPADDPFANLAALVNDL